jgi:hypothetical protein
VAGEDAHDVVLARGIEVPVAGDAEDGAILNHAMVQFPLNAFPAFMASFMGVFMGAFMAAFMFAFMGVGRLVIVGVYFFSSL